MPCNGPCITRRSLYFRPENFQPDPTGKDGATIDRVLPAGRFPAGLRQYRRRAGECPRPALFRLSRLAAPGRGPRRRGEQDIERALSLDPNDSDALALQAIIAVVQNDKDKALEVAQKAVGADPKSATAQIALSYAQQASLIWKARAPV